MTSSYNNKTFFNNLKERDLLSVLTRHQISDLPNGFTLPPPPQTPIPLWLLQYAPVPVQRQTEYAEENG